MNLFLDNKKTPQEIFLLTKNSTYINNNWVIVRSFKQFKDYILDNPLPELISFRHDLAEEHSTIDFQKFDYSSDKLGIVQTGRECVQFLIGYCLSKKIDLPRYMIHDTNGLKTTRMRELFNMFDKLKEKHEENRKNLGM